MKSGQLGYILVVVSVVVLSLVYLHQRNTILEQGYKIGHLKCAIDDAQRVNHQLDGEIQALVRPERCWGVLGDRMVEFSRIKPVGIELPECNIEAQSLVER